MEIELIERRGKTASYNTKEGFAKKLSELYNNKNNVAKIVQHECSHFHMAEDLGYKPLFCLDWFEEKEDNKTIIEIHPYIWAEGLDSNPRDLFMVSLAPEEPSNNDIENAKMAILSLKFYKELEK